MEAVLQKSDLYKLLIEINDSDIVKKELSSKITEEIIDIVLNLDIEYLIENPKLWNELFYLQINNIQEIRAIFVEYIYYNNGYKINLDVLEFSVKDFITKNTCINKKLIFLVLIEININNIL